MDQDSKLTALELQKVSLKDQKARQKEKHEIASESTGNLNDYSI